MRRACAGLELGIGRHLDSLIVFQRCAPEYSEHAYVAYHLPTARLISWPVAQIDQVAFHFRRIQDDLMQDAIGLMRELHDAAHGLG